MSRQKPRPRAQLSLKLENVTTEPVTTPGSMELLEALADLLLAALCPEELKLGEKEDGDES